MKQRFRGALKAALGFALRFAQRYVLIFALIGASGLTQDPDSTARLLGRIGGVWVVFLAVYYLSESLSDLLPKRWGLRNRVLFVVGVVVFAFVGTAAWVALGGP